MFFVELFKKAMKRIKHIPNDLKKSQEEQVIRKLIHDEAMLGGALFGPLAENKRRDFFCYDEDTWVWHESIRNNDGTEKIVTTRYEIKPHGIVKIQDNKPHEMASFEESLRLLNAAAKYTHYVKKNIYQNI